MYLFRVLQDPSEWRYAAQRIADAMRGDGTAIGCALLSGRMAIGVAPSLVRSAVSCNDNAPFAAPSPEIVVDEILDVFDNVSRFAFSVMTTEPDGGCQYWPVTPPERYLGPWNHTLRNPILIVSNTVRPMFQISLIINAHCIADYRLTR